MTETAVTLASVEAYMTGRRARSFGFPSDIERQFEADTHAKRCKRLTTGLLVSAPLYNLFLLADWLLVPDVMRIATWLHFGFVTPWMLLAAWLVSRKPKPFVRECLAASVPLLIILQIDLGFALTTSAGAAHYQYVVIPTLLYTNVSLHRLEFRFARGRPPRSWSFIQLWSCGQPIFLPLLRRRSSFRLSSALTLRWSRTTRWNATCGGPISIR